MFFNVIPTKKNLIKYIKNDQLFSLPLQVLYRILTKYQLKNANLEKQPEFIEFLFKCLDHFGQEASAFSEQFDFGRLNAMIIQ